MLSTQEIIDNMAIVANEYPLKKQNCLDLMINNIKYRLEDLFIMFILGWS